jgi:formylglycine-generating enzyme required for sulfatase activity
MPTELEWEYAFCWDPHGGKATLTEYPWGNDFVISRCNTRESGIGRPTPIGLYSPEGGDTRSGATDMTGNVLEWTLSRGRDGDGQAVYPSKPEPYRPEEAEQWTPRVQKGGTFLGPRIMGTRTYRLINLPDLALQDFGFRIVRHVT